MEKFGFVGLPNAGKSSLYNALSGGSALAAPYAFATKEPNVGMAKVIDERLDQLSVVADGDVGRTARKALDAIRRGIVAYSSVA